MVASGTLLAAAMAIYFGMTSGDGVEIPFQSAASAAASPSSMIPVEVGQTLPEDDPYTYLSLEEFELVRGHGNVSGTDMGVLPEDDPYAYLTLEEFNRQVER